MLWVGGSVSVADSSIASVPDKITISFLFLRQLRFRRLIFVKKSWMMFEGTVLLLML